MKNIWDKLKKPIIGLSPMEGYTDSPYRRICKEINPDIVVFTEFTSTDGLHYAPDKVKKNLEFKKQEKPIIAQIFGNKPEHFYESAKLCEQMGFDGIDLNMGCPAKKVIKSEQGMALRKTPDKAFELVKTVVKATSLPVSVKTRLGWSDASDLIEFGKGVQDAGASLITIHGRTYKEPYNVPADWEPIYKLKEALDIYVFGNGGITSIQDGLDKLQNLEGFLIGQAAIGNPWVFDVIPDSSPVIPAKAGIHLKEKIPTIKQHVKYFFEYHPEDVAVRAIRKHLLAYIKGIKNATAYRERLAHVKSKQEIFDILNEIKNVDPKTLASD